MKPPDKLGDCIHCGQTLEDTTFVDFDIETMSERTKNKPGPGDYTICWYCAKPMAFDDDMKFRKLTPEEEANLRQNTTYATSVMGIRYMRGDDEIVNGATRLRGLMQR